MARDTADGMHEIARQITERALALVADQLSAVQAQRSGGNVEPVLNGYYDATGAFHGYLRCDVDNINSGKGCVA